MRHKSPLINICLSALCLMLFSHAAHADLVGFWSFDQEEAIDLSGNGNDGVDNGTLYSDDTYNGEGFSLEIFPNTNVQVPHSDSLDINDTMTIAFWMKADNANQSSNWNGPMSKSADVPDRLGWEFQRFDDQSRLDIRIDTDEGANSVRGNLTGTYDDEWVHMAWTVDEGEWASFLDGEIIEAGGYPHGDGFANDQADLYIGCRAGPWCAFEGLLDDIGIWNEVLSDEAIADLASGISPVDPPVTVRGDYNADTKVDVLDIDLQAGALADPNPDLGVFDENDDGVVNNQDREIWVNVHKNTWMGDSNLDGEFGSGDLVAVFTAGKFETGQAAGWAEGDWNGDMVFGSGDLVTAFQAGGFEMGPRPAAAAVPEPTGLLLLPMILLGLLSAQRRRR